MGDEARKLLLSEWQNKRKEVITYPYLNEKVEWGVILFAQAMLLSRYLRGDIDGYPSFFWKQRILDRQAGGGRYMLVLTTYDVDTGTAAGRARLRKVVKQCVNYGARIQNPILECTLDSTQLIELRAILTDIIDEQTDSLRFYNLENRHTTKVNHAGMNKGINMEESLIF